MNQMQRPDRREFFNFISNYEYFNCDFKLGLEPFCVYLSSCFAYDGILDMSPQPRAVYDLLVDMIHEAFGPEVGRKYVECAKLPEPKPGSEQIYPDGVLTLIHPAALVMVSHDWIAGIGYQLVGLPEPVQPSKYFEWAKEEWVMVHTFINGYHNAFFSALKQFDHKCIPSNGYSMYEALHVSHTKGIDFDKAVEELVSRHEAYRVALGRITNAIDTGFYLEAIALEECLVSNCLNNFLRNRFVKMTSTSFSMLIKALIDREADFCFEDRQMFRKLDDWRKARNTAIHGFISAHSESLKGAQDTFASESEATARQGVDLSKAVVEWYERECVQFVQHEFEQSQQYGDHTASLKRSDTQNMA